MSSNVQIDIKEIITNQAMMAKKASQKLATLSSLEKNKALLTMAHALEVKTPIILEENNIDKETRFDAISVLPDESGKLEITHLENAFEAFDAN